MVTLIYKKLQIKSFNETTMSRTLSLKKPVAFFDLETTGISPTTDLIIEIAVLRVEPNGIQKEFRSLVNPGRPIPADSSAIHGIFDKDVANSPSFEVIAKEVLEFMDDCDLGGYNCNRFDIPMLIEEFARVGIDFDITNKKIVDVQRIFFQRERRDLSGAYKFYCDKDLIGAHSAMADVKATYEVLLGQINMYEDLATDMDGLHDYSNDSSRVDLAGRMVKNNVGQIVFNFGKHRHKEVKEVLRMEPQYYDWIMKNDFPAETKKKLTEIRLKSFNT